MKKISLILSVIGGLLLVLGGVYLFAIKGKIIVDVKQDGAIIKINGIEVGNSSVTQQYTRGKYQVLIEKEGYTSQVLNMNLWGLQKKKNSVDLELLPEESTVATNIVEIDRSTENEALLLTSKDGTVFESLNPKNIDYKTLSRVDFGKAIKSSWSPTKFVSYIWREDGTSGLVDLKRYDLLDQIYNDWGGGVMNLGWSNNGSKVVYVYKPGDGEYSIIESNLSLNNKERIIFDIDKKGLDNPKIFWTRDDKNLLLVSDNIYVYNFYNHKLNQITKTGGIKEALLSYNGKYIVFSDREATYVCEFDGSNKTKIGPSLGTFNWMTNKKEIIGYSKGEFVKINVAKNQLVELGYNGKKIEKPKDITLIDDENIYYLINDQLKKLKIQAKKIEVN